MFRSQKYILLFSILTILFASCERENSDVTIPVDSTYEVDTIIVNNIFNALSSESNQTIQLGCQQIQLPFEVLLASGDIVAIQIFDDFFPYLDSDASDPLADFIYPIFTIDQVGEVFESQDAAELSLKFANCLPDNDAWNYADAQENIVPAFLFESICLEIVYPVFVSNTDTTTQYIADSEVELADLLIQNGNLFFNTPFSVLFEDDVEYVLNNFNDFIELLIQCSDFAPPLVGSGISVTGGGCLELIFPISVLINGPNGEEEVFLSNINEYLDLFLEGAAMELQYPFVLADGFTDYEVFCELALAHALQEACDITIETDALFCGPVHINLLLNQPVCFYEIVYPIQLDVEGSLQTFEDNYDYEDFLFNLTNEEVLVVYPVDIYLPDEQITVTVNSDDDVFTFLQEECN